MLILAFDTATTVATTALVRDRAVLGERRSVARAVLEDANVLIDEAGLATRDLEALVVGTGPGSFTGMRMGLAAARGLALALDLQVAGVSTLAALAAGAPGAVPVLDGGRGEVFSLVDGEPTALSPDQVGADGRTLVGSGAVRYRDAFPGAEIPPDDDERHVPWARFHAELATRFGAAEEIEPLYLRPPDARPR